MKTIPINTFEDYWSMHLIAIQQLNRDALSKFQQGLREFSISGQTLWVAGNGGSQSTASHAVADFNKTISQYSEIQLRTIAISDMPALTTAYSNDIEFSQALGLSLKALAQPCDALMLFSVSGTSPNLIEAINYAKQHKIVTFGVFGLRGAETAKTLDYSIVIPAEDYQVVENIHVYLMHWFVKSL